MSSDNQRSRGDGPGLGLQQVGDFFSSAQRRITVTIWLVRIIAIFILYLFVFNIWSILLPEVKDFSNLFLMFDIVVLLLFAILLAITTVVGFLITLLPLGSDVALAYLRSLRAFSINQFIGDLTIPTNDSGNPIFNQNTFFGNSTSPFAPLAYLLNKPQRILYNTEFLYGVILLGLLIMVITGIGFIRRSSVYLAGFTLVTGQFVIALAYLKGLTVGLTLETSSVLGMFNSSLFQLAFISYLYFEFSLQTGYLYKLINPTLSRQERVGKQLSRLSKFRLGITKLGTEEEKETAEAKKQRQEEKLGEEEERVSSSMAAGSGSTSAKKYSSDALLFLLDSAQDSMFSKPGGEQERLTGRLQRYHDGLLQHDPKLDDKLGGSAEEAFKPFRILLEVLLSMAFRITLLVILTWLVVRPELLLEFIALPPTLTNSIEISEPEGFLIVLIPVVFMIIGGSYLVSRLQEWVVKAEELIIEESEIDRLIQEGEAITDREEGERVRQRLDQESASGSTGSDTTAESQERPRQTN